MPGKNCAVVGCPACKSRHKGLSFFGIRRKNNLEWENALVRAVNRSDASFNREKATICSRHFKEECFKTDSGGSGRTLIPGSIPTEFMPRKSVVTPTLPSRKPPIQRQAPEPPLKVAYYNFAEVRKAATGVLPAPWCLVSNTDDRIVLAAFTPDCEMVKLKVYIQSDFTATVHAIGLPVKGYTTSIETVSLSVYLKGLSAMDLCPGVQDSSLQELAQLPFGHENQRYYKHVQYCTTNEVVHHVSTVRSTTCRLLVEEKGVCRQCLYTKTLLERKFMRTKQSCGKPLSKHHSLQSVPGKRLVQELKKVRKENAKLQKQVNEFKKSMKTESIEIAPALHDSMVTVMKDSNIENPLQKLFWEEQLKSFTVGDRGMRWHPMMLRLAILLHSRSPAAYDTLRKTGVLHLPGESTLRDYTNVFHPKPGFQRNVLDEIVKATKDYSENQRFVVLLHDEMTLKSDLVFDKRSGELVGFVNSHEGQANVLATHALVFYVVGVSTILSTSLGFFGTQSATADTLYPLFWKAVGLLENVCNLKVIASTSDKASPNLRLYDLHGNGRDICHKTTNLFAPDREIFFFSDVPHLVKTVRNNLSNSGAGKRTRHLWLNGKDVLWKHIVDVYDRDVVGQLRKTKLTHDHISLTPSSVMNVKLAAQVLSHSVGTMMAEHGGPECQETAKFILKMDRFFDCLNTRSLTEGTQKRKTDLLPYRDVNDVRFDFLAEFLGFLIEWKHAVDTRQGDFTKTERSRMFLSHQTFKGLVMTLKSFPEVTRYLLTHGVDFVLSNRFCQDPLEKHFGRQRGLGRRSENPNLWRFGYNENKLMLGRTLGVAIQPKGNVGGKRGADHPIVISTSPLKKIKRN